MSGNSEFSDASSGCSVLLLVGAGWWFLFAMLFNWCGARDDVRDGPWRDSVCAVAVCPTPTPEPTPHA